MIPGALPFVSEALDVDDVEGTVLFSGAFFCGGVFVNTPGIGVSDDSS